MQTEPTIRQCKPIIGVEIDNPKQGTIYLLPTAHNRDGRRAYMDSDALLLKWAVMNGVPVEYAVPEENREFVEHFSSGAEIVALAVSIANLIPSTIQGIYALIQIAALRKGIKEENLSAANVQLEIDYLKTSTTEARGIVISGDVDGVVAALGKLSADS